MAYFPDLSPYSYGRQEQPGVVHVGWLDDVHPYTKGTVPLHLLKKLKGLRFNLAELYRGFHICELCAKDTCSHNWSKPDDRERMSNGEIRIAANGVTFAAPLIITHYIEKHSYLPPQEFLKALEELPSVLYIGWLNEHSSYDKGTVPQHLLEKLKRLALHPTEVRELYGCELCSWPFHRVDQSNRGAYLEWSRNRFGKGEIRVMAKGQIFSAPVVMPHYIEEHGYLPPLEFLKALEEMPG